MGATATYGEQSALLPELQRPAQPTVLPRVGLWGVLAEDARHYTSISGQTHLQVLVQQHVPGRPEACPVLATYHYPDLGTPNVTAQLASRAAAALRRGAEVLVTGEGLHPWHHNGQPAMALGRTQSIRPIQEPSRRPTTSHQETTDMPFHDNRVIDADGPWRVLAPRHEVMWRDGTTAYLHPVMQGDVPSPMLRAVRHEGLRWVILDLRSHSGEIEADLKSSLERDAPGIVFYTLRQAHRTAREFTDHIAMHHVHAWWQGPTAEAA